jgi:hypothetical protein
MPWLLYPQEGDPIPIVKVGVWVGMVAGLAGSRKAHLQPWFEPWTFQPVVGHCTNWRRNISLHLKQLLRAFR